MSFTVFLGNLPAWVTKDDIKSWLNAENLVFDDVKVIRNPETQESKGFAFIDTPNSEEMSSIIRRFDRAPLEDRMLRANQAQPPRSKAPAPGMAPASGMARPPVTSASAGGANGPSGARPSSAAPTASNAPTGIDRGPRRERGGKKHKRSQNPQSPQSAFAEELAKAL
ncbi:MAG TPA: RNA-binding protein [Bryobacteraceae bacterium]|nr:RNA-binding protein [Bryobacteraceae bacterium]